MIDIRTLIAKHKQARERWPTIFHAAQLAFPWGSGKRLRKRRKDAKDKPDANPQRPTTKP